MTRSLAIIPARGGSQRFHRKNIRILKGKPLISWTIEAAITSGVFDEIIVSTEDEEIASISSSSGATVLRRPDSLATDIASCAEVCEWHLRQLAANDQKFDRLYCLYATAPMRSASDIKGVDDIFNQNIDCKAVIAVTSFSHYPYQAFELKKEGTMRPYWPELCRLKSSQLPMFLAGNGSTYAVNVDTFFELRDFYSPSMDGLYPYLMEPERSIDIDTEADFLLLQALLDARRISLL